MSTGAILKWAGGQVTMQARGAMLRDLRIRLPNGQMATPLHTAPWVDTPEGASLTGLIQGLSGEWPCVPFGEKHTNLPQQWRSPDVWEDPFPHGYAAHHDWDIRLENEQIKSQIDLPLDHPIQSLKRTVRPIDYGISIDLWVNPRNDCRIPMGLHPVFTLPDTPQQIQLEIEGAQSVWCHPESSLANPSPAKPGAVSESLTMIQSVTGDLLDFSRLPRAEKSETRLLVTGGTGQVTLTDITSGIQRILLYDATHFPYLMLWVSNKGRSAKPWSSRHLALGIEPVRAAFDLGSAASAATNPLAVEGEDTAFDLTADQPFHTNYSIKVLAP